MSKPTWKHTHTSDTGEALFLCEGKYYTRFAWDNFLEAYRGKVTAVNSWRNGSGTSVYGNVKMDSSCQYEPDFGDLWPEEDTQPMGTKVNGPAGPGGWTLHVPPVVKDGDD